MLVKNALPNAPDQGQRLVEFHDVFTQRILTVYKYSSTTPTCWQEAFSPAMLTRIYGAYAVHFTLGLLIHPYAP